MDYTRWINYLSLVGIIVSAYMIHDHFEAQKSVCDLSATISCSVINRSVFSELFNVPVAVYGVVYYIGLLGITVNIFEGSRDNWIWVTAQFLWNIAGIIFVVYLVGAEIILRTICPFCTIVHIIVITQAIFAYRMFKQLRAIPDFFVLVDNLKIFAVVMGVMFLLPTVYFNIPSSEPEGPSLDPFAKCLTARGVTMYGSDECPVCLRQKKLFKDSFAYIDYYNCNASPINTQRCSDEGIDGMPTWTVGAKDKMKKHEGLMTMKELEHFSGEIGRAHV